MARRTSNKPPPAEPVAQSDPPPLLIEDIEVDLDSPLAETKSNGNGVVPADLAGPEIEVETTPPPSAPPVDDEKETMRRRVAELEASEALARDYQAKAQQVIEQLAQRDQQSQQKVNQSQWNAARSEYDATVNGIAAANSEIGALKEQIRQAGVEGNWEVIAEAQSQIGTLSYDLRRLDERKGQLETWAKQVRQRPKQQQQPRQQPRQQPGDPIEATIAAAPIPDRAKVWLREHREYMSDPEKNAKLQAFHWDAKRETGGEYTDAYFGRMEELLGLKEGAPKPAVQSTPSVRTGGSVSAPPTREALSMSTGRSSTPTKVTLNAEEREVARSIAESRGMSQAEGEREYARQKLKMIKEKQVN